MAITYTWKITGVTKAQSDFGYEDVITHIRFDYTGTSDEVDSDGNPISNDFTVSQADATSAEVSVFSIYVQDEIGITDQLDVILGMRYDRIEQSVSGTSKYQKNYSLN